MKTKLPDYLSSSYSTDKRKRRNQHRVCARNLIKNGGFFNNQSAVGSSFWCVAQWHLLQAKYLGR